MAQRYEKNYDWSQLGPTVWTERSVVTLQVDLHSYDRGGALWTAAEQWWSGMEKDVDRELFPDGTQTAFAGGCRFPAPVRVTDQHVTAWVVSHGEDAFDSIAHYAEELRRVAESADAEVAVTWTELPHR